MGLPGNLTCSQEQTCFGVRLFSPFLGLEEYVYTKLMKGLCSLISILFLVCAGMLCCWHYVRCCVVRKLMHFCPPLYSSIVHGQSQPFINDRWQRNPPHYLALSKPLKELSLARILNYIMYFTLYLHFWFFFLILLIVGLVMEYCCHGGNFLSSSMCS